MYTKKWVKSRPFRGVSPFLSASSNHLFAISSLRLFSICLYLAPIRRAQIPDGAILSLKSGSLAPAKSLPHNHLRTLALSGRSFFNPDPLFSITCGLFSENTGVWGGSIASGTNREGTPIKRFQPACPPRNFSPRLLRLREAAIIFAPHGEIRSRNGGTLSRG